jgi:hypothetical protein
LFGRKNGVAKNPIDGYTFGGFSFVATTLNLHHTSISLPNFSAAPILNLLVSSELLGLFALPEFTQFL